MSDSQERGKRGLRIKTYVVLSRRNLTKPGEPNVEVVAVLLSRAAAQAIIDKVPGTYFEKHLAVKDLQLVANHPPTP